METLNLGFNLEMDDTTFLDRMISGGISDDLTPRSGDISFDDHIDYMASNSFSLMTTQNISAEVSEILDYIDSI